MNQEEITVLMDHYVSRIRDTAMEIDRGKDENKDILSAKVASVHADLNRIKVLIQNLYPDQELRQEFQRLTWEWKDETRLSSSSTEHIAHPAFLRIIGLGPKVIPLIIEELKKDPFQIGWWSVALSALTGLSEDFNYEAHPDINKMAAIWIARAEKKACADE